MSNYRKTCVSELRHSLGWPRQKFAYYLGVSEMTILRWESGRSIPRGNHLADMHALSEQEGASFAPWAEELVPLPMPLAVAG